MPETISSYKIDGDWTYCANGDFAFASRFGKKYFLKRLPSPKYPYDRSEFYPDTYERLIKYCSEFEKQRRRILDNLRDASKKCPMLIVPDDFFRDGASYYLASQRITDKVLSPKEITALSDYDKKQLILQFAEALYALESVGIVHGDLKPSNVFVCKGPSGVKLNILDFDDCYRSEHPPPCEATMGSMEYYSPELGTYICSEDSDMGHIVTCASDVFAAGLMIHEYICGEKVGVKCKYPFQADIDSDITISKMSPEYAGLIRDLLRIKTENRMDASEFVKAARDLVAGRKRVRSGASDGTSARKAPVLEKGPYLRRNPDGNYLYIAADGGRATISPGLARDIAKLKKIPLHDAEEAKPSKPKGDDTPKDRTVASDKPVVIERKGSVVSVRMADGSVTTMPATVYEIMKKKGKL